MKALFQKHKICAILRNIPLEKTIDYVTAAFNGGIRLFEVAMNSPHAEKQIQILTDKFGDRALIGAGTVINKELCLRAKNAGAQFFLTPSVVIETLEFCAANQIKLLPGVLTPTDVSVCLNYGYKTFKLFPACDMPQNYIKSLLGPFDNTNYVAVGGVKLENASDYLKQGFIGVGIGGSLIPKEFIEKEEWEKASQLIRENIQKLS